MKSATGMYDGEKAAFAARTAESEGMKFFNGRESSRKRKRTVTYNIVMLVSRGVSSGARDSHKGAVMPLSRWFAVGLARVST